jgi:hypothetical protein
MTDLLRARCLKSQQKLITGFTGEDIRLLSDDRKKCHAYFERQRWCASVTESIVVYSVPRVLSLFLVTIAPDGDADTVLWSVVGDLPSAYFVIDDVETPADALDVYIELMEDWVVAVRDARGLDDVFPVEAEASMENASLLEGRLGFLRSDLVPYAASHWAELFGAH